MMALVVRLALFVTLLAALLPQPAGAFPSAGALPLSDSARAVLAALPEQAMTGFILTLRDQMDPSQILPLGPAAPLRAPGPGGARAARSQQVIEALQNYAAASQSGLLAQASALQAAGQVGQVTPLWIMNGLSIQATAAGIRTLAGRPEVALVRPDPDPDFKIVPLDDFQEPFSLSSPPAPAAGDVQPNISLVNAPALWDLGISGQGVVVASLDTGVDGTHPDLASSYRGGSNSWYDPYRSTTTPYDPAANGHGTHTMGIMVGKSASGPFLGGGFGAIGMAPGAKWISAKVFDDNGGALEANFHLALQWVLDPDGNPATPDGANIVNNSWGYSTVSGVCKNFFAPDIANLRLAGVLPVFSAGNNGQGNTPSTDGSPANNPGALAVGAIDNNSNVWTLSARGPSSCATGAPFPSLVAPGVNIVSAAPVLIPGQNSYHTLSGTSMAAPHAGGAAALLLSAYPDMPLTSLEYVLTRGAFDLGDPGLDIHSGYGRLDVLASYQLAKIMWGQAYHTYIALNRLSAQYFLAIVR
jgi:subtilisin family serine protease